jgi:hypothetical protein
MEFLFPSVIASLGLPLEAWASEVAWMDIARTRRLPSAASLSLYMMQPYMSFASVVGIVKKYGWPSKAGHIVILLQWVLVGRCQFAAEPGTARPWMRRTTYVEFCVMLWATNVFTLYLPFHLYCIHDGQWDGKVVGRLGGVFMVLLELTVGVVWFAKYGRLAFSPGAPTKKQRADVVADSWVGAMLAYSILVLINYAFLFPDDVGGRILVTMTNNVASFSWTSPVWEGIGPVCHPTAYDHVELELELELELRFCLPSMIPLAHSQAPCCDVLWCRCCSSTTVAESSA